MLRKYFLVPLCATLSFSLLNSCSDDSSDPKVIDVAELMGPGDLYVADSGEGSVTLYWSASNPEDDFEGYNIYGGKVTAEELASFGVYEGSSLQLLSQTGEPSEVAKSLLQKLDYNAANPNALPGAPARQSEEKDEEDKPKFDFLPIHVQDSEGKALVPTCQPAKSSDVNPIACEAITSEDSRKKSSDVNSYGTNMYTVAGLTPGESYCFIVFSVQDEGSEISQSSSTVQCVIPKIKTSWSALTLGDSGKIAVDLKGFADECSLNANGVSCPTTADFQKTRSGEIKASSGEDAAKYAIHFEAYSGASPLAYMVGGKNVAIKDVGFFSDFSHIPTDLTPVKFPANYSTDVNDATKNALVGGNYTRPFASVVLKNNRVYLVAIGDDTETPTTFTYHWVHIQSASGEVDKNTAFTATFLLNKKADVL